MMSTCTKTTFKSLCGNNDVGWCLCMIMRVAALMASLASNTTQIKDNSGKKPLRFLSKHRLVERPPLGVLPR